MVAHHVIKKLEARLAMRSNTPVSCPLPAHDSRPMWPNPDKSSLLLDYPFIFLKTLPAFFL